MSITEAAACGTPSVVVDIAGHHDAVRDGDTGLLVAPGSSLAGAIARVLTDPVRLAAMSDAALAHAASFSWDAVARRLFELLAGSRER
jgi:glycosyltransferase involved in cell wall biosynthesis